MKADRRRGWAEHPDLVGYYTTNRRAPEELYPSERRFLPWLASRSSSVLDVGCGAGGFASVWRSYQPGLRYTGVDVSAPLVEAARIAHPGDEFLNADCVSGLPLTDRCADVVAALGWLHWEVDYRQAVAELWRVTRRHLFFDLRLAPDGREVSGRQRLELNGRWDGHTTMPYICRSWPAVAELLVGLDVARMLVHGYWGSPADTVAGVQAPICFATFVLERRTEPASAPIEVSLELPLPWPARLSDGIELIAAEEAATTEA